MKVSLDQAIWVNVAVLWMVIVQDVAAEGWNSLAVEDFRGAASRLCILSGHAGDTNDWKMSSVDEDQRHLEEELDLRVNGGSITIVKELCTITSLQEESLSECHISQ